jgi:hypothetical protein
VKRTARATKGIVLVALFVAGLCLARGDMRDSEPLNLFQRTARATLVVHVRVRAGALKYAQVDVIRALKGEPPARSLRIAFRDYNLHRPQGGEPLVFPDGEEEILFLVPYGPVPRSQRKRAKNVDLFELMLGPQGRITVPAEGSAAFVDAIGRLAGIASLDPASQVESLRNLLDDPNPDLIESALDEILRLRAATPALYPRLGRLIRNPSPSLRARSLRLVTLLFGGTGSALEEDPLDLARETLALVRERARNDPDEPVRVQAVLALAAWRDRHEVAGDLQAIARQDRSQLVRFEAERALLIGPVR